MKKRSGLIAIIISIITAITIFIALPRQTVPAITYFPIDEQTHFLFTTTDLKAITTSDPAIEQMSWTAQSKSEIALYLRQDVSLLYENGHFKGLLSKWSEQTDIIELNKNVNRQESSLYQAITYHYGEVHHDDNTINAIQHMSSAELLNSKDSTDDISGTQHQIVSNKVNDYWNQVLEANNIDQSLYLTVPLIDLDYYNSNTLPLLTPEHTNKVIGQLWEGLYKNYIIPITATDLKQVPHIVPLVLFDKESRHLIVLFEVDGHLEKLYQRYSF